MKVIFMGTPHFAVPTLQTLINSSDHEVVAVLTQEPKAKDRGLKLTPSPVHILAKNSNLPIYTPKTLRSEQSKELINSIVADIIVVVAYGFILPKEILFAKKYGCLNIHPSLLPKYRGAAPLQRTIMNNEKESAICVMQMDEGLDTGDIIMMEKFEMPIAITYPALHDYCADIGAKLLIKTLDDIETLPRIKQSDECASYANKLSKEEGKINWEESAYQIDCKIRGMNPWPGTYFEYNDQIIKILEAEPIDIEHNHSAGAFIDFNNLVVACGQGAIKIRRLQLPGKKALSTEEFLLGSNIFSNI